MKSGKGKNLLQLSDFQLLAFRSMTSAKVFSILRKYQMPLAHSAVVMMMEERSEDSERGVSPRSRDHRKPSMTPTMGLSE